MRTTMICLYMLLAIMAASCGGRRAADTPSTPPPPIDENLIDLVPFETDMVIRFDMKTLRASSVWALVERTLGDKSVKLPVDASLKTHLFAFDEIIMAYLDGPNTGEQLLVLAKGSNLHVSNMKEAFGKSGEAKTVDVEPFVGLLNKKMLLVPVTERTVAFGNEVIVRMSVKTSSGKSRPLLANPRFEGFGLEAGQAAALRYRSDVEAPDIGELRRMMPRVNPAAVTEVDAGAFAGAGLDVKIALSTQTQMDASVIAEDLNRAKDELRGNMIVLFLGVTWMLDRIQVSSEKDTVKIDIALDDRDIMELGHLVERLQKIQELLDDSGGSPFKGPMMRGN